MTTNQITCQISWKQWSSSPDNKFLLVTWTRHIGSSSHNKGNLSQRKILLCRDFHKILHITQGNLLRNLSLSCVVETCQLIQYTKQNGLSQRQATTTCCPIGTFRLSENMNMCHMSHVTPVVSLPASCASQQKEVRPETSPEF